MRVVPLGREEEAAAIYGHLKSAVEGRDHGILYVSGMPGCGKTLTCQNILKVMAEKYTEVKIVEINCGGLILPSDVFLKVHQQIVPGVEQSSPRQLEEALKHEVYTIILADEIDMLISKGLGSLYGLLELPSLCKNVYLVSISNTYNLPDRRLTSKVRSRLGWNRLNFAMYKKAQVVGILKEAQTSSKFTTEAIEYCANKICTLNGDIRKAFQIQRWAVEYADKNNIAEIGIREIDIAIKNVFYSVQGSFIQGLSLYQQILLRIIAHKGAGAFPNSVYEDFKSTLILKNLPVVGYKEYEALIARLSTIGALKGRSNSPVLETKYIPEELDAILNDQNNQQLEIITIG
ncbi:origin recognition complex subunit 1 [Nematocida homosporus]|uniref:origin recognition complex subunit 1 n=1 Tax=Nematocida homosporus TaxID=1912981 RepID=UPI0022210148|nr:origin recognition complex subunit 1 [Nematocida homosporus]KAI5184926.1 origin recognition complex subunit 1 [Nematocida homosporus]